MDKAQGPSLFPRLFALAAIALAAYAVVAHTGVVDTDLAGVRMELPGRLGPWTGHELLFCSGRDCGRSFFTESLPRDPDGSPVDVCPDCGKPLASLNWAEQSLLPADTGLTRRLYTGDTADAPHFYATIVLSGNDRSSIHRPQVCMTAAGHEIQDEYTIQVDMGAGHPPLDIRVLDLARPLPGDPTHAESTYYAYWFIGRGRTTAFHVQRMVWMATDRIFHGINHRWAYVSLSGPRNPDSNEHIQTIANIVSRLHPAILLDDVAPVEDPNP